MPIADDERPFRLVPRAPKTTADDGRVWASALRRILQLAQQTRKRVGKSSARKPARFDRAYTQRCAVRVTYAGSKTRGQWAAHGRYLERESAVAPGASQNRAFNAAGNDIDLPRTLETWQHAGDERVFKMILSPEFSEGLDLADFTCSVLARIEGDLQRPLEWAAVAHYNTDHPHVHVVLRGVAGGEPLRLPRDLIKRGIRTHAEDLCTARLGYRTALDVEKSALGETLLQRVTSLDRKLRRLGAIAGDDPTSFQVGLAAASDHLLKRLAVLRSMGLAEPVGRASWRIRSDFEHILRSMQNAADRQRMLAANAALLSDERLPFEVTALKGALKIEGRVLGHVLDDVTGRVHMLLEGTDAKVHFVEHTREIESARHRGQLKPNAFVRLERPSGSGRGPLSVRDFGSADRYLTSPEFRKTCRTMVPEATRAAVPVWGGWLGRYYAALTRKRDVPPLASDLSRRR